ncbi:hypothetical protein Mycch_0647 [Mycolicibacterium chubuense NBB4]|uniref:Uncharacterized protein n=1 Tax=Mycolicibacterium chubuense (strain NBB4) TaxID=710421 RepID=I4BDV8_MYCCN|nr:hypothetical protein [Mycolicibacterium chubuense]AFM15465.1 hypothetical protein Mycch_0647 [Mycolicibacterium chubuense NBB4]
MWWPVAAVGAGCFILVVALVWLLPNRNTADRRQPLAHTARLTRLPEYRAVVRRQTLATAMVLTFLTLLFAVTVLAGARPTGSFSDAARPREDIMLCVGQPVADPATGAFLNYFARQATTYGTERIGLTSVNRRLVPLTRDYQFAAGRFGDFAQASRAQAEADAGTLPPAGAVALRARTEAFSAPVAYTDYTPTVADVLALCLTGFPDFERGSETQRSLVYLGPGVLRAPGDTRPSLYTDAQVTDMARRAGVRIDTVATAGRDTASLATIAKATDGSFVRFDPAALDGELDAIRSATHGSAGAEQRRDAPDPALIAALALAGLLGVSLTAVRR